MLCKPGRRIYNSRADTDAAHCLDEFELAEFFAQALHMDVDGAIGHQPPVAPGAIEHLRAGEDAARMLDEQFEELEFLRGQNDFPALAMNAEFIRIDRERSVVQFVFTRIY